MQALVGAAPPLETSSESDSAMYEPGYMLGYLQQSRLQAALPPPPSISLDTGPGANCLDLESVSPTLVEEDWSAPTENPLGQRMESIPQHADFADPVRYPSPPVGHQVQTSSIWRRLSIRPTSTRTAEDVREREP
jgi:hypothetical protein